MSCLGGLHDAAFGTTCREHTTSLEIRSQYGLVQAHLFALIFLLLLATGLGVLCIMKLNAGFYSSRIWRVLGVGE